MNSGMFPPKVKPLSRKERSAHERLHPLDPSIILRP
jgi:hypothetical protein